jgi:hypothetical protein
MGNSLDLLSISRSLRLKPSHQHKKGEPDRLSDPYPTDLWSLSSPLPRTDMLATHLEWLRNTLAPHYGFLRNLSQIAKVRSFCGIVADGTECAFSLSSDDLRLFTEMDIEMEVSLIFVGYSIEDAGALTPLLLEEPTTDNKAPSYGTRCQVSFEIHGDEIDQMRISDLLRAESSKSGTHSEVSQPKETRSDKVWSLPVLLNPEKAPTEHILSLKRFLTDHADSIRVLTKKYEVLIRCQVGIEIDNGGFGISAEALKLPVELGLSFNFETQML